MRLLVLFFLSGCISLGPADWRPDQHIQVMRACQAMCAKAGGAKGYTIMDGECECRQSK